MKKNILIISIIIIITILFVAVNRKFKNYKASLEIYNTSIWLDFDRVYSHYLETNLQAESKEDFVNHIEKNDKFDDFKYYLDKIKYNILLEKDTVSFYFYGFDNDDDNCLIKYDIRDVSFIKSLFKDGDIVFYKKVLKSEETIVKDSSNVEKNYPPLPTR